MAEIGALSLILSYTYLLSIPRTWKSETPVHLFRNGSPLQLCSLGHYRPHLAQTWYNCLLRTLVGSPSSMWTRLWTFSLCKLCQNMITCACVRYAKIIWLCNAIMNHWTNEPMKQCTSHGQPGRTFPSQRYSCTSKCMACSETNEQLWPCDSAIPKNYLWRPLNERLDQLNIKCSK